MIDEDTKSVFKNKLRPLDDPIPEPWFLFSFGALLDSVDSYQPFLPGRPNKSALAEWDFTELTSTDAAVFIRATPKFESTASKHFTHFDLMFDREPIQLCAVRVKSTDGNSESTFIFYHPVFNVDASPEPDLSEYKIIGESR